ncbi:MAG: polysaccharide biosynthesis protein, partial [Firmicutes bacterium]|nr:polysaccharide biosynthesis protein [Bacillota bacterium]
MPIVLGVHFLVFALGGVYYIMWHMAGISDSLRIVLLEVISCVILLVVGTIFGWVLSRAALVLMSALTGLIALTSRLFWQMLRSGRLRPRVKDRAVMVVGAGESGIYVIDKLLSQERRDARSIVLVDNDPCKRGVRIHGVAVRGAPEDIPDLVSKYGVQEILIAIPSLRGEKYADLASLCGETGCRVRILTTVVDGAGSGMIRDRQQQEMRFRELNPTDFLSREEIVLDTASISEYLTNKTVLVTGGGGSIGAELCRQVIKYAPKALYIFDVYENNAYELLDELRRLYDDRVIIRVLIGSVRDKTRLSAVFGEARPDVVFHAAAHKHVPLMEYSPGEAIKNNVIGTLNVLDAAVAFGTERFVLLSTDKAVNPTNVMGATKRVCEMLVQLYASHSMMKCMAVRFGNVLGSHGSVIPLFESQIRDGGPVTVTHPEITRYFITIPEAAQLVLQAGGLADNGAIYALDMGEPVKILDLAEKMIRFYGYEPYDDIQIAFTGLRAGEKMYEELLTDLERDQIRRTSHDKIFIAPPIPFDRAWLIEKVRQLESSAERNAKDARMRGLLQEIVETYQPLEEETQRVLAV